MIDILNQLSDNQMALLGCIGAAGASLLLLTMSYHGTGGSRTDQRANPAARSVTGSGDQRSDRRAA